MNINRWAITICIAVAVLLTVMAGIYMLQGLLATAVIYAFHALMMAAITSYAIKENS